LDTAALVIVSTLGLSGGLGPRLDFRALGGATDSVAGVVDSVSGIVIFPFLWLKWFMWSGVG
jgi:hypothetical protein